MLKDHRPQIAGWLSVVGGALTLHVRDMSLEDLAIGINTQVGPHKGDAHRCAVLDQKVAVVLGDDGRLSVLCGGSRVLRKVTRERLEGHFICLAHAQRGKPCKEHCSKCLFHLQVFLLLLGKKR